MAYERRSFRSDWDALSREAADGELHFSARPKPVGIVATDDISLGLARWDYWSPAALTARQRSRWSPSMGCAICFNRALRQCRYQITGAHIGYRYDGKIEVGGCDEPPDRLGHMATGARPLGLSIGVTNLAAVAADHPSHANPC